MIPVKPKHSTAVNNLFSPAFYFSEGTDEEAVFFCSDLAAPTPLSQIKMHVRKEFPLCLRDGGEVRWGSEIMSVFSKSHFPPFEQRGENLCNVIRSLIYIFFITLH